MSAVRSPTRRGLGVLLAGLCLATLEGCAVSGSDRLAAPQRADVARVQSYLDRLHGLRARFVQVGADGGIGSGIAWYDPGRLRLDYASPGAMVVVASGRMLVAHRASDDSTTRIALSGNPLGLLLARPLRLSGDIEVTNVQEGPGALQVSLARASAPAQGLLTLVFADSGGTLALVGLEAVDARGQRTRINLQDVRTGVALAPGLFDPPSA